MMMRLFSVPTLAAVAIFSISSASAAQERRVVPEARVIGAPSACSNGTAGVDGFIKDYRTFWGNEDADALAALHSDDTEWINAYARMFNNAKALRDFLEARLFPAFEPETSREEAANMKLISVRYIGPDAAVVHMYTDGHRGPSRIAGESGRRTHLHLVLERQDCDWQVVHTAIMDAR